MTVLPLAPKRDAGLPEPVSSHKSGGRDRWTGPLERVPDDPLAAAWAAVDVVLDPEMPISLVELGLVHGLELEDGVARVRLTVSATAGPCRHLIRGDVRD